jgi:hypothetical protein
MAKVKKAVGRRRETENAVGKGPCHVLRSKAGMTVRASVGNAGPLFRTAFRALLKKGVPDFFAKVLLQLLILSASFSID